MAEKNKNPEGLQGLLKEIRAIEDEKLEDAKETLDYRKDLRTRLKQMLEARTPLPANSEFYAGLKKTNGRVNYREVAEELVERYNIQDSEYAEIVGKYKKPSLRLKYGSIKDKDVKRLWQSEFEFITPEGILS